MPRGRGPAVRRQPRPGHRPRGAAGAILAAGVVRAVRPRARPVAGAQLPQGAFDRSGLRPFRDRRRTSAAGHPKRAGDRHGLRTHVAARRGHGRSRVPPDHRGPARRRPEPGRGHTNLYFTEIRWLDAGARPVGSTPFDLGSADEIWHEQQVFATAPPRATAAMVRIGFDSPNLYGGRYLALARVALEARREPPAYVKQGELVSRPLCWPATGRPCSVGRPRRPTTRRSDSRCDRPRGAMRGPGPGPPSPAPTAGRFPGTRPAAWL